MKSEKRVIRWLSNRLPSSDDRRIVIVTGARQTGKTTLIRQSYPALRYVNLDAYENREWVKEVSSFNWAEEVGASVIDEAQKETSVFEKVKYAFDEGTLSFSVLSGSAQILLLSRVRETLAGRAFVYELWPLMFCECAAAMRGVALKPPLCAGLVKCESLDALLSPLGTLLPPDEMHVLDQVGAHLFEWGGMPELLRLDDEERRQWLRSYEITYLERDLGDLARLSDLAPFKKFQRLAALRSGRMLSYAELAKDAGVSTETARRYLEYLRLSYQAVLLQPYHVNLTSQVVKTPKLYWIDPGVLRQVSGLHQADTGELFETFVVGELNKWVSSSGADIRLFYYRTRSGLEVDILIERGDGLFGIEIKSRESVDRSDASGLRRLAEAAGERWRGGMVVYRGSRLKPLCEPDIWAVPFVRLLS